MGNRKIIKGGFMKHGFGVVLSIVAGLALVSMAHAAQRVVVCEELYQEG
jgi:hypothetical protein